MPNATPDILADYLTPAQLAKQLGRCEETLKRWRRLRVGPPVTRIGVQPYYSRTGVAAWLQAREQKPRKAA
jgi:hypothetical protein